MTDMEDTEKEELERRKKKGGDEGAGDGDPWGRGKAGAASGIARLPPQKLKEVMADWRHLDMNALMEAIAEFFSDLPMRASANLSVAWERTKTNVKSFAVVNWILDVGHKAAHEHNLTQKAELTGKQGTGKAGKGTRGFIKRADPRVNPKPMGPMGPGDQ